MKVPTIQSLNHQQVFLRILIFSVVTIMIWIGFSLFRSQQAVQIPAELQKMAIPLNPTLDLDVISRIEQKRSYSDQELSNFPVYILTVDRNGAQNLTVLSGTGTVTGVSQSSQVGGP